jgi:transcriptional regulator with XRE-family HTH domain
LRKAMGKTQVEMAKRLGVGQDAISRVEARADMLLSTLGAYVKGMGGELTLVAQFPGRAPVRLTGFELLAEPPAKRPRAKRAAKRTTTSAPRKRRKAA